jgi:hypothetical protein
MNKLNKTNDFERIIKGIKGGKSHFNKLMKLKGDYDTLRLQNYLQIGSYFLDVQEYFKSNDLKKDYNIKSWIDDNFKMLFKSYNNGRRYANIYLYEEKQGKFKNRKGGSLKDENLTTFNSYTNFIRGNKEEPIKKKAKKNNNKIVFVFSVGDSSSKYKIEKTKRGDFVYYLNNKLIEPSKVKEVHNDLIELMASLNIYQHEEIPEINS